MSVRNALNGTPVPGYGLSFDTVEEFSVWWDSKYARFLRHVLRKVQQADAEDILQNVICEIISTGSWSQYDPSKGASAETWSITRLDWRINSYLESREQENQRAQPLTPVNELDEEDENYSDDEQAANFTVAHIEQMSQRKRIARALACLSAEEAEVINLTYYDCLPEKDVAKKLGLSGRDQVAYLKKTALRKLRENGDLESLNPHSSDN